MPASTVPPYKDENIYICDIVDLPPDDDDVKTDRAIKRHTYFDLRGELDITVTAIQDAAGDPVVDPLVAAAAVDPLSGTVLVPLTISYSGSLSTGLIVDYHWEIDKDAGGYITVSHLETSTFQITTAGTYTLRLTVTDLSDATAVDSEVITVT